LQYYIVNDVDILEVAWYVTSQQDKFMSELHTQLLYTLLWGNCS